MKAREKKKEGTEVGGVEWKELHPCTHTHAHTHTSSPPLGEKDVMDNVNTDCAKEFELYLAISTLTSRRLEQDSA